jgi:nonsense-mediated mRNA decay protein 3
VQRASAKRRGLDKKMRLAEVVVARESDLGVNDTQHTCVTHLGHILKEGDMVFGYDLTCSHWTSEEDTIKVLGRTDLPDVVLVRKCYKTKGERRWLLKSIQFDETAPQTSKEQAAAEGDYEVRTFNLNLYPILYPKFDMSFPPLLLCKSPFNPHE